MARKKKRPTSIVLPILVVVVAVIGVIYFRSQLALQPQPLNIMEVGKQSGMVDLSFASTDSQHINLTINTENAKVSATQIEITYDSKLLGVPKVEIGDFFALKLGEITTKDNLIKATVAVPIESGGKAGSGNALTLTFPQKPTQATSIAITNNTIVAAIGYDFNVLKTVANLTLTPTDAPVVSQSVPQSLTPSNPTPTPHTQKTPTKQAPIDSPKPNLSTRTLTPTNFGNNPSQIEVENIEQSNDPNSLESDLSNPSVFAKFISWIKLIFNN